MSNATGRLGSIVIAAATAVGIVALVLPLFLNPAWVGFEQGRARAAAWTGFAESDLRDATDAMLGDLIVGPPDFDVTVGGEPVLNPREQSHMRDVRVVFMGFFGLAIGLALAAGAIAARRRGADRLRSWRAVQRGAGLLVATLLAGGIVAVVAFETMFEVFHQLFFAGGSYTFDPATERLVQLFPFAFWQESAIAVGAVCIVLAVVVALVAERRLRGLGAVAALAPGDTEATGSSSIARPVASHDAGTPLGGGETSR